MKTGMVIPRIQKVEINYVYCYNVRKFPVILPRSQAFGVFFAPVKQTPFIHIVLVPELYLDIHSGIALQYCPDIEYAGLVADYFCRKGPVLYNFHRAEHVIACPAKDGIEESEELYLIALLAHYLVKKVII